VNFQHEDILIISIVISNHKVHHVLVEDDNVVNILFTEVIVQIGISSSKLTLVKTPFIGIKGLGMPMKGALELHVVMGTPSEYVSL
jgi:ATP-dependent phosphoenolpyruvate carboxykinase